jgi:uncharacterized protein
MEAARFEVGPSWCIA